MAKPIVSRAVLEEEARNLIGYLEHKLGIHLGIALFVFEFGEEKNLAYISNAQREGMIETVKEWLARQEAGLQTDPPGPRAKG